MKLSNTPPGTKASDINGQPAMCPRCFDAVLMSDDEQERNLCNDCADQDFAGAAIDHCPDRPGTEVKSAAGAYPPLPAPISPALNATSCSRQTDGRRDFSEEINQEPL